MDATPLETSITPPASGRSLNPWIFLGCGCLSLIVVLVLGIVGFVFYKIKDSEAGRLTTQTLRQSQAAQQVLGDIEDTGWPLGSISVEGGGSGHATFSMSVKGSKAKGKYFATLQRENGQWRVVSDRLELNDGRSVPLSGSGSGHALPTSPGSPSSGSVTESPSLPSSPIGGAAGSGGRVFRADRNAAASWRPVEWPSQGIRFEVPADWNQESLEKREVSFRPKDRSAYFIGNLTYFDRKIPFETLMQSMANKAAAELKREEILGYALRDLGKAKGLLRIERRGDGQTTAAWSGYYDTAEFGTVSVTFLLGAPTLADFEKKKRGRAGRDLRVDPLPLSPQVATLQGITS